RVIEFDRFRCRGFRTWKVVLWSTCPVRWNHAACVSDARVSESVARVFFSRLLKEPERFLEILSRAAVPEITSFQVKLVRLGICCWVNRNGALLRSSQACPQSFSNRLRDIAFDCKDVGELAVVSFGPEMRVCFRIDQLDTDAYVIGRFLYAAFENVCDAELLCHIAQTCWRALVSLRRRS